jgi:hypothetical protein
MTGWRGRVEDLLYEGETVRETVEFEGTSVVVTSHRVLAFTPEMDGANFKQVDRPNVVGVDTDAKSEAALLERTVKVGLVGGVLLVGGYVLDFGAIVGDVDLTGGGTAGQVGIGNILGPLQSMLDLLRSLDLYMQLAGALALLLAVALFGVYWHLRDPTLVIEVAGDDDIHVPRPGGDTETAQRLERAVAAEQTADPGGPPADRETRGTDAGGDPLGES